MKSKDSIYKEILRYINLTWDVKNINNLDSLIHLMIRATGNELFLLGNKLEDTGLAISERLTKQLSPAMFDYVRPAHCILRIPPFLPLYTLDKHIAFSLKELPAGIKDEKLTSIFFTPVIDSNIYDANLTHMFFDDTLWSLSEGKKKITGHSRKRGAYNTVWLALDIHPEIKTPKGISFYLDFEHLPDHHDYFDILSYSQWHINGIPVEMAEGFRPDISQNTGKTEKEILAFYKDHYLTIHDDLELKDIPKKKLPDELADIIDDEVVSSMRPRYWFSVKFPAHFRPEDLKELSVWLNAVPFVNRSHNTTRIEAKDLGNSVSLLSKTGQEFLDIEFVTDSGNNTYDREIEPDKKYTYTIEAVQRTNTAETELFDTLERFSDIIQNERSSFPGIDSSEIAGVFNAMASLQDNDIGKVTSNRLHEHEEAALFTANPGNNTAFVNVSYWTTHAAVLNGIPPGMSLQAVKALELNKSDAYFLTETRGGLNFHTPERLRAANNFQLTSNDRILTKHHILGFCMMELGEYIDKADVVRKAITGRRPQEGIVAVMEIQLTPKHKYAVFLKQKWILKDFLIRLRRKSPDSFDYRIKLVEEE